MSGLGIAELALLLIFGPAILSVVGWIFLEALKILRGDPRARHKHNGQDARIIQELHRGLARMEERIEALETLLLERHGKGEER